MLGLPRWLHPQTQSQRLLLLLLILVLIGFAWFSGWEEYYRAKSQYFSQQVTILGKVLTQMRAQQKKLAPERSAQALAQQLQQLHAQLQAADQQARTALQGMVSATQMAQALQSILTDDQDVPIKINALTHVGSNKVADPQKKLPSPLYQHNFMLQFQGDYFATAHYLRYLQHSPWRLYWDSLDYQVGTYPQAEVTVKFHVLSLQEHVLHA